MSWHYLQAQEEASWAESSLDGAPDALSSLMPTAGQSCWPGNETDCFQGSQSGTTCGHSTETNGKEASTSSLEGSRARTSARPGRGQELTEAAAGFGRRCGELLARYCLSGCSWKTPLSLFSEDLHWSLVSLPRSGMMQDGLCWELTPPGFRITEPAFGWWPTPSGVNGGKNHVMGRLDEWGGSSNPWRQTPTGKLSSPEFEETVMGFPTGWTARTPLGTHKFQSWLHSHGQS